MPRGILALDGELGAGTCYSFVLIDNILKIPAAYKPIAHGCQSLRSHSGISTAIKITIGAKIAAKHNTAMVRENLVDCC